MDENPDEVKSLFQNGDIVAQDPFKPGGIATQKMSRPPWQNDRYIVLRKMARSKDGARKVGCSITFNTTRLRVPDGRFDPKQVFLRFSIWSSEPGQVSVMIKAGTKVSDSLTVPRPNQWCPLKVSFGALTDQEDGRMRPDALVQEIRFAFTPSGAGKELPVVCIDKVIVCHQDPPDRVALMLMAWQARMSKLIRSLTADGFCYNDKTHVAMRKLAIQNRHRGPVLVFMPPVCADGDLSALFSDAAREAKLRGERFEVAQDPRHFMLSGLENARAFLPYLLAKTDARAAILVLTRQDAVFAVKEPEYLRLILERLLASHCMPMLCLPAADESDRKVTEFNRATVRLCDDLGIPYADQGVAFRSIPQPYVKGTLTAEGQKALSTFLVASYGHVREAANLRR